MRKIVFPLLCLMACVGMHAEVVKLNGLYYSLGTTTAQVVADQTSDKSVYSAYTTVTIPATVTYNNYTYAVNSIATSAFESCSNLQSVVLPASITTIGTDAFYGCTRLASVTLVEGLTAIYTRARSHGCLPPARLAQRAMHRSIIAATRRLPRSSWAIVCRRFPLTCAMG